VSSALSCVATASVKNESQRNQNPEKISEDGVHGMVQHAGELRMQAPKNCRYKNQYRKRYYRAKKQTFCLAFGLDMQAMPKLLVPYILWLALRSAIPPHRRDGTSKATAVQQKILQ
jgi:hypothetical protein